MVENGGLEAAAQSLRQDPLDSIECYAAGLNIMWSFLPEHSARWRSAEVVEAMVTFVERGKAASDVLPHACTNRTIGQVAVTMANSAEGRALLLGTPGMKGALFHLVEHGGDAVGIAANRTLVSPCGMNGLALALLLGREESEESEESELLLSAKVGDRFPGKTDISQSKTDISQMTMRHTPCGMCTACLTKTLAVVRSVNAGGAFDRRHVQHLPGVGRQVCAAVCAGSHRVHGERQHQQTPLPVFIYCILQGGVSIYQVSDAHKQHFLSIPQSIDSLRAGLGLQQGSDAAR